MDQPRRELLVARVVSGCVRVSVAGRIYLVRRPSREQAYLAQEIYQEQLYEAGLEGLYDEESLMGFLLENGFWDEEREKLLRGLPKEIDQFKLKLYKASFRSNERTVVRRALETARARLAELEAERHAYDSLSCQGVATMARSRYLLAASLFTPRGEPVFPEGTYWEETGGLLDQVAAAYAVTRLGEKEYRELARTEPWRSLWACRKAEGSVFGVPPTDYTDEQRALTCFSCLYDNVYEHPDCPSDDIVADDDMLDGWLIDQRQQREQRQTKKAGEELVSNEKIRGAQEVYLVADTLEDARKVVDLNDEHSKSLQRQRFAHLREKGEVNELEMPDTRRRLRMEVAQRLSESVKG